MEPEERAPYPREDRACKGAAQMLGDALVSLTELGVTVKQMLPTEQVVLHVEDFMEDFNFETDDDRIVHLEFESDPLTKEDLMRFRGYESVLSYQYKKEVITCVLCSADRKRPMDELNIGISVYRVKVIYLKDWISEEVLENMEQKQGDSLPFTREELLKLCLIPLMGGKLRQTERICRAFHLLRREREHSRAADFQQLEGVLYILAEKFLGKRDLEKLKEEMNMTRIGKMLFDDGMAQGITQGMAKMTLAVLSELGVLPQKLTEQIQSTKDTDILENWGKIAAKATSIEDFCEKAGLEK